ncbi:unnamed protein product [Amoebophrya sp. A120]|nr:unnamed protein product [Amoebophrya sp. A120]|eukprot:GSA120T00013945001.1
MDPPLPWRGRLRTANTLYELEEASTTIGRDPQNDLVLDSRGISRFHAILTFTNTSGPCLTDKGSANGTFVNSHRLAKDTPFRLNHGDFIFFSAYERTHYRFELPDGDLNSSNILGNMPEYVTPPAKEPLITGGFEDAQEIRKRQQYLGVENLTNVDHRMVTPRQPFVGENSNSRNKIYYGKNDEQRRGPQSGTAARTSVNAGRRNSSSSGMLGGGGGNNYIEEEEEDEGNTYQDDLSDIRAEQAQNRMSQRRASAGGNNRASGVQQTRLDAVEKRSTSTSRAMLGGRRNNDDENNNDLEFEDGGFKPRSSSSTSLRNYNAMMRNDDGAADPAANSDDWSSNLVKKKSIATPPAVKERLDFLEKKLLETEREKEVSDVMNQSGSAREGVVVPGAREHQSGAVSLSGSGLNRSNSAGGTNNFPESGSAAGSAAASGGGGGFNILGGSGSGSGGVLVPNTASNPADLLESSTLLQSPDFVTDVHTLQRALEILSRIGRAVTKGYSSAASQQVTPRLFNTTVGAANNNLQNDVTMTNAGDEQSGKYAAEDHAVAKTLNRTDFFTASMLDTNMFQQQQQNGGGTGNIFNTTPRKKLNIDKARKEEEQDLLAVLANFFRGKNEDSNNQAAVQPIVPTILNTTKKLEKLFRETKTGQAFLQAMLQDESRTATGSKMITTGDNFDTAGNNLQMNAAQSEEESDLSFGDEDGNNSDNDDLENLSDNSDFDEDRQKKLQRIRRSRGYLTQLVKQQDIELSELRSRANFYQQLFPDGGPATGMKAKNSLLKADNLTAWRDRINNGGVAATTGASTATGGPALQSLNNGMLQQLETDQLIKLSYLLENQLTNSIAKEQTNENSRHWKQLLLESEFFKSRIFRAQQNLKNLRAKNQVNAKEVLALRSKQYSEEMEVEGIYANAEVVGESDRQRARNNFNLEEEQQAFSLKLSDENEKLGKMKEFVLQEKLRLQEAEDLVFNGSTGVSSSATTTSTTANNAENNLLQQTSLLAISNLLEEIKNAGTLERVVELENCARFLYWKLLHLEKATRNANRLTEFQLREQQQQQQNDILKTKDKDPLSARARRKQTGWNLQERLFGGDPVGGSSTTGKKFLKLKPSAVPPVPKTVQDVIGVNVQEIVANHRSAAPSSRLRAPGPGSDQSGTRSAPTGGAANNASKSSIANNSNSKRMEDCIAEALRQHNVEQARMLKQLWREKETKEKQLKAEKERQEQEAATARAKKEEEARLEQERINAGKSELDAAFLENVNGKSMFGVKFHSQNVNPNTMVSSSASGNVVMEEQQEQQQVSFPSGGGGPVLPDFSNNVKNLTVGSAASFLPGDQKLQLTPRGAGSSSVQNTIRGPQDLNSYSRNLHARMNNYNDPVFADGTSANYEQPEDLEDKIRHPQKYVPQILVELPDD